MFFPSLYWVAQGEAKTAKLNQLGYIGECNA